jgi:hypothetical protein
MMQYSMSELYNLYMLRKPSEIFFSKINERWPKRDMSQDHFGENHIFFSTKLDLKKTTAKIFVDQLLDYVKNDKDDQEIVAIFYNNKKSSGEQKDRFWIWQEDDIHQDDLIHIYFKNSSSVPNFHIPFFSKKMKKITKKKTLSLEQTLCNIKEKIDTLSLCRKN